MKNTEHRAAARRQPQRTHKGGGGSNRKAGLKGQTENTKAAGAHGDPSSGRPTEKKQGGGEEQEKPRKTKTRKSSKKGKGGEEKRKRSAGGNKQRTPPEGENQEEKKRGVGQEGNGTAPRPKAPQAGNQRKHETAEAQRVQGKETTKKRKKTNKKDKKGTTPARGAPSKAEVQNGQMKGEGHQNAPGRPACPTRSRKKSTRIHAREPGVASSYLKEEVWASRRNCPGAPAESPVERRTVQETGRVSDRVRTRKPPQRTQPRTDAGGTHQGQPHRRAPNRYEAEQAQSPCLGRGQRQAPRARFSAGLHMPRAAAQ